MDDFTGLALSPTCQAYREKLQFVEKEVESHLDALDSWQYVEDPELWINVQLDEFVVQQLPRVPNLVSDFGSWAKCPETIFPDLRYMNDRQRTERHEYFVSLTLSIIVAYSLVGTILLMVRSRLRHLWSLVRPSLLRMGCLRAGSRAGFHPRRLVGLVLFIHLLVLLVLIWICHVRNTVATDPRLGLPHEFWIIWLFLGLNIGILEVFVMLLHDGHTPASLYVTAMTVHHLPFLAEKFDPAKDLMFALLTWHLELHRLAMTIIVIVLLGHLYFIMNVDIEAELAETYLPICSSAGDDSTGWLSVVFREVRLVLLKQVSLGRKTMTICADLPQAVIAAYMMTLHPAHPYVVFQLLLSGVRCGLALCNIAGPVHGCLVLDLIYQRRIAVETMNVTKVLTLTRQIWSVDTFQDWKSTELKDVGFSAKQLKEEGLVLGQLQLGGFTTKEIHDAGFEDPFEFVGFGCKPQDLKNAGFSAKEVKTAARLGARDLREIGYGVQQVTAAGFGVQYWKVAGFTVREVMEAGCSFPDILAAGYSEDELRQTSVTAKMHAPTASENFPALQRRLPGHSSNGVAGHLPNVASVERLSAQHHARPRSDGHRSSASGSVWSGGVDTASGSNESVRELRVEAVLQQYAGTRRK